MRLDIQYVNSLSEHALYTTLGISVDPYYY